MPSSLAYTIRSGTEDDLPGIVDILNEQIATSSAIFTDDPLDVEDRRAWLHDLHSSGYPLYVAVPNPNSNDTDYNDGATNDTENSKSSTPNSDLLPSVLGFAAYGQFRSKPGYRYTVETSLYIHKSSRGTGLGSALLKRLIDHAKERGNVHVLVASTSGDNVPSIKLHEKFGFENPLLMKEVGYKFGKWQDMVFLTLNLPIDPTSAAAAGSGGR